MNFEFSNFYLLTVIHISPFKPLSFEKSSIQIQIGSTAAGHVDQKGSAHVACSRQSDLDAARLK